MNTDTRTRGKNREHRNEPTCTWSVHENETRKGQSSAQLGTGNAYFVLIFPSCSASLLAGTEATLLLSAWTQSRYPEARALTALRRQSPLAGHRAQSEGKASCARDQRGIWRPLLAAREERAAPCSESPEGSPRGSSAVSTRTGRPN